MKLCKSCGETKPLTDYHNRTKSKDGKQSSCKECNRKQRVEYYKTAKGRSNNVVTGKRMREANKRRLFDFLQGKSCLDCGEEDIVVLQFDHRNPSEKFRSVSSMINQYSWTRILVEIGKCDLVCANCHTRRTAKQFGWFKALTESN